MTMTMEKAIQMLRLYEVNEYGEGELKTWYNGIDKDMREALDMAIEALSADAVHRWIPCSERLPSDANEVLACTDGVWVDIAKYNIGREEWYVIGKGEKNITAWMPLPTPYKGGDTE